MRNTAFLILAAMLPAACASAPASKPAAPSPPAATTAPAAPPAEPTSSPVAAAPSKPEASVVEFALNGDETDVKIKFLNPTSAVCSFTSYTLVWPGGKKRIESKTIHVPANGMRMRSLRVHKDDGDTSSLNKDSAHVEVETDCGG